MSEVVLAASSCRTTVTEVYQSATAGPGAGKWGCESNTSTSKYVQKIGTNADGVIAVQIAAGIDSGLDNQYVYLVPYHNDTTPKAVGTSGHMGAPVFKWVCGSDNATVRKYLPGSCSASTTAYSASFS
ncbi:MAG: pilin [Tepidimonas sp.]|nr:pilin [Tepidimonas sp.]